MIEQKEFSGEGSYTTEMAIVDALHELGKARSRYPWWPCDIVHATVIMVEESTEALKAANEIRWSHKSTDVNEFREEVIQTIAMCFRLLTETEVERSE